MHQLPGGCWYLEIGGDCRCAISWPDLRPIVSGGAWVGPAPEPRRDATNCPVHGVGSTPTLGTGQIGDAR